MASMKHKHVIDPYVQLSMAKVKKRTKVVWKSSDPIWNESFEFFVQDDRRDILDIKVFDKERFRIDQGGGQLRIPMRQRRVGVPSVYTAHGHFLRRKVQAWNSTYAITKSKFGLITPTCGKSQEDLRDLWDWLQEEEEEEEEEGGEGGEGGERGGISENEDVSSIGSVNDKAQAPPVGKKKFLKWIPHTLLKWGQRKIRAHRGGGGLPGLGPVEEKSPARSPPPPPKQGQGSEDDRDRSSIMRDPKPAVGAQTHDDEAEDEFTLEAQLRQYHLEQKRNSVNGDKQTVTTETSDGLPNMTKNGITNKSNDDASSIEMEDHGGTVENIATSTLSNREQARMN
eukprot:jgi/Bigna1/131464/aug1.14_g6172